MQPLSTTLAKIAKECEEAGATQFEILKILKELENEQDLSIDELRLKAAQILHKINPKAAKVYESLTSMKVFTSGHKIKPFDMGNIVKSLLRETKMHRTLAQKIGSEVEEKLKDLDIEFLNTALIRELTDVKLLEYGKESAHYEYCRHGMPTYDIKEKLQKEQFLNEEILTEYHLFSFLPKTLTKEYFERNIFIEDVAFFSNKVFSYNAQLFENNFDDLVIEVVQKLNEISKYASFFGFSDFNLAVANALQKEAKIEQKMKFLMKIVSMLAGKRLILNLNLNASERFEHLKRSFIFDVTNLILKYAKNINTGLIIEHPLQLSAIKFKPNFILCAKEELYGFLPNNKQILGCFSLRLNKDFEENKKRIEVIKKAAKLKEEVIKSREYLQHYQKDFDFFVQIFGTKHLSEELNAMLEKFKVINCISEDALKHFNASPERRVYNLQNYIVMTKKIPKKEFYCVKFI